MYCNYILYMHQGRSQWTWIMYFHFGVLPVRFHGAAHSAARNGDSSMQSPGVRFALRSGLG